MGCCTLLWPRPAFAALLRGKPGTLRGLFLEARTGPVANASADDAVVWSGFAHCLITPAGGRVRVFVGAFGEGLVRQGGDVHFFCAEMAADVVGFHGAKGRRKT